MSLCLNHSCIELLEKIEYNIRKAKEREPYFYKFLKEWRMDMQDFGNTQYFKVETEPETGVKVVLSTVYEALTEKGYNPLNQIVGYIMSGDPTYITSHNNARSLIMKVERDELVEELLNSYIKRNGWK